MRTFALLTATISLLAIGLVAPGRAEADTPGSPSWADLKGQPLIVLAEYRGHTGSRLDRRYVFDVLDVLKGPEVRTLRLEAGNLMPPGDLHGRWLLLPDDDVLFWCFRVSPSGVVANPFTGEAQALHYPRTLAGWYRALGLSVPDTGTLPPARPSPDPPGPAEPLVLLLGALLGAALTQRRLARPSRRPR